MCILPIIVRWWAGLEQKGIILKDQKYVLSDEILVANIIVLRHTHKPILHIIYQNNPCYLNPFALR